ncbi:acetyl-CoA carboxylase biotin carboxyl carrier protein [Caldibacillus lycopersici]|uniref:Biotin carboxyl carrier protein of acetyl-CoA carboxylase n=1 Tax=Perspicuibacillus lycopersici TaxID=1325689 RepID=A0AAE3ISK2_9BACI|nr:acetyl-CoA carboxylase biotin carboxyl carrier protein [Perspicuibacillus lycopersici]MCU9613835.1 acetyl-CoA carboxylase biotin carboxyl carrier protein [Perspicuibacillus lycopersici]
MLKVQEIRELIRLVDQSSIDEFTFENEGIKLIMKKNNLAEVRELSASLPVQVINTALPQAEQKPVEVSTPNVETKIEAPVITNPETAEEAKLHTITSPMVGTFYNAPSPGAEPYVKIGSPVTKETIVCIVEAMKLFNEIEADVEGEIAEILVEEGQLVEFGQPLFSVKVK